MEFSHLRFSTVITGSSYCENTLDTLIISSVPTISTDVQGSGADPGPW